MTLAWDSDLPGRTGAMAGSLAGRPVRALLPDETAAVVSLLLHRPRRWGLLAVGQRRGEPLTDGDLELLDGHHPRGELAHANRRLLDEVAVSLEQLQAPRTAAAGVEAAAGRGAGRGATPHRAGPARRGAARASIALGRTAPQLARARPVARTGLEELAAEAERAVFSLQDLARGIYPSVLTDRGVAAAIRSYIGRLPLAVALDVAPRRRPARWPADLEVALYFVAVESLGNSRKHAAATTATGHLAERAHDVRAGGARQRRGLRPAQLAASGSGLQHMADRMAALGGGLVVNSRRGAGTWVTAAAAVVIQRRVRGCSAVACRTPAR